MPTVWLEARYAHRPTSLAEPALPATKTSRCRARSLPTTWRLWPLPNHTPGPDGYSNDRLDSIAVTRPTDRFFLRVDENLSNSQRLNLSVSRTHMTNNIPAPWQHAARSFSYDHDVTGSLQYNWVLSPTSILDVHLGFGVAKLYSDGVSGDGSDPDPNIDTTTWGFDPLIVNNPSRTTNQIPPVLNINGFSNVGGSQFDTFHQPDGKRVRGIYEGDRPPHHQGGVRTVLLSLQRERRRSHRRGLDQQRRRFGARLAKPRRHHHRLPTWPN